MEKHTYLSFLEETINSYSKKTRKYLVKIFEKEGILKYKKSDIKDESIYISKKTNDIIYCDKNTEDSEALIACLRNNDRAVKRFEKWEFEKDYKYFMIFSCEEFVHVVEMLDELNELEECENEYLFDKIDKPIYYKDEDRSFLKFNIKYVAYDTLAQKEILLKYVIVVVFHKNINLIEIRYDMLKRIFVQEEEQNIYIKYIKNVISYITEKYGCKIAPLDLYFMLNIAKNDDNDDIKLTAQYMRLCSGGSAQLEVGDNQEYMLPLIGELKTILVEYKNELEEVPSLKDALEQFMYEKEEMSDYPWIEVLWEDEIKTRNKRAKIVFNFKNEGYSLIQHYYSNVLVGMERMNYVIEYIAKNRNNIEEKI